MIKRKHYLYLSETEHNTLIRRLVQMKNKLTRQGKFYNQIKAMTGIAESALMHVRR